MNHERVKKELSDDEVLIDRLDIREGDEVYTDSCAGRGTVVEVYGDCYSINHDEGEDIHPLSKICKINTIQGMESCEYLMYASCFDYVVELDYEDGDAYAYDVDCLEKYYVVYQSSMVFHDNELLSENGLMARIV
jgi:hypothetical protein